MTDDTKPGPGSGAGLDPRITPARADIAAEHLKGRVEAKRFVAGSPMRVALSAVSLRKTPSSDAEQVNQALFGEGFTAYDEQDGWLWGQLEVDGYVGWMAKSALGEAGTAPTHRVAMLRTHVYSRPDMKSPTLMGLSMNARLPIVGAEGAFSRIEHSGWIFTRHIAPLGETEPDFVAVAERFVGAPYLWGGRESLGLDCSGLIQVSMAATGRAVLRDSDMQAASIGEDVVADATYSNLKRGDLIFWAGHVGVMADHANLLHASARDMKVEIEPLAQAIARILPIAGPVKRIKRP